MRAQGPGRFMMSTGNNVIKCIYPIGFVVVFGWVWLASIVRAGEPNMASARSSASRPLWLYVGTYTHGKTPSEGIYLLELDPASGRVTPQGVAAKLANPSFLAIHPGHKLLYAVNEMGSFQGKRGGAVSALSIDPQN